EIEHKAVLEPLEALAARGFEVKLVAPGRDGAVRPEAVRAAVRDDTLLVSVMHVNNETGVRQPVEAGAVALEGHEAYLHVDAAQGFGKELAALRLPRVDLVSISSHKIYGPVGVGGLVARRRGFDKVPLACLMRGGGQERGLRPGTLPVALIAGLGAAAEAAAVEAEARRAQCAAVRERALAALRPLGIQLHGTLEGSLPHVLSFSVEAVDSEALMVGVRDLVAVSNGSACTSQSYAPSHVLEAMGRPPSEVAGAVRMSWCHLTPAVDWEAVAARIVSLR
ncbi:MAG: aminotransferase class V-fold PLP-dependent enzyme, partial [Rhodospirillaceae bacterium]|nr:aminotransferase class V-fold PLP-dependent enzyme [Rhodospirillaceae bacterium]